MLSLLVTTTLVCGLADSTSQNDAAAELAGLAAQLTKVESYQFTTSTDTGGGRAAAGGGDAAAPRRGRGGEDAEGGDARGGRQRGGQQGRGGAQQPRAIEGVWKSGLPMQITVGDAVAYKDGEQIVYADSEGAWKRFEMPAGGRGGFGGQGAGGARGRGGAGGERGRGGDAPDRADGPDREAMQAMRALRSVVGVTAPHEQFKDFAKLVSAVEKSSVAAKPATEGEDAAKATPAKTVYKGKLTEAGVEALGGATGFAGRGGGAGRGGRGGGGAGGGAGGMQMETSGTFTIEVVDGAIANAEFVITRSGSFGEREFERTTKRSSKFSSAGKAKLVVPEDALALFEL